VTGLFGGVVGSVVLAIATDLFPFQTRGRVMGVVQTAFSARQVLGMPGGLYIANLWNWHMTFVAIVLIAIPVSLIIIVYMRLVSGHLALKSFTLAGKTVVVGTGDQVARRTTPGFPRGRGFVSQASVCRAYGFRSFACSLRIAPMSRFRGHHARPERAHFFILTFVAMHGTSPGLLSFVHRVSLLEQAIPWQRRS
jgi:MFS family permease